MAYRTYVYSRGAERHFYCDTEGDRPVTGLTPLDTAFTASNGKYWKSASATSWVEAPWGGGGGSCQVPTHESQHNHSLLHDGVAQNSAIAGKEPANSNIQAHVTGTGSPHTAAGVGAEAAGAVAAHDGLTTPHASATSVGGKTIPAGGIADAGTLSAHTGASAPHGGHAAISHQHNASDVNAGTLDGDRLPAMSATKKGAVPATGTPSNKFLRDDNTWQDPPGGGGGLTQAQVLARSSLRA
jgi:hypothetical protein